MSFRAQHLTIKSAGHLACGRVSQCLSRGRNPGTGWVYAPNTPSSLAPLSFTRPEGTKQEDRTGG
jgi:hypothetical protein